MGQSGHSPCMRQAVGRGGICARMTCNRANKPRNRIPHESREFEEREHQPECPGIRREGQTDEGRERTRASAISL